MGKINKLNMLHIIINHIIYMREGGLLKHSAVLVSLAGHFCFSQRLLRLHVEM